MKEKRDLKRDSLTFLVSSLRPWTSLSVFALGNCGTSSAVRLFTALHEPGYSTGKETFSKT